MKTIGQIAFEAYNVAKGGVTYDGKPIPPWTDVGDAVRGAWEAAGAAVLAGVDAEITAAVVGTHPEVEAEARVITGPWVGEHRGREVTTTDGQPPELPVNEASAPKPVGPDGQHRSYWVLSEVERAKGFVRPVRTTYLHKPCGTTTTMGRALAETYAREPSFYSHTFCIRCAAHLPVAEFTWDGTTEVVGS